MRLHPLDPPSPDATDLAASIVASRAKALPGVQVADAEGTLQGPFACLPYTPSLGRTVQQVGTALRRSTLLSGAVTEAVILAVATHWRADYEWYAHAASAIEDGSLEAADLHRIAAKEPGLADPAADVAAALTRELLETTAVSDGTWAQAQQALGDRRAVEVVLLAGYYSSLAMLIRTFETPLPAGAQVPPEWRESRQPESGRP